MIPEPPTGPSAETQQNPDLFDPSAYHRLAAPSDGFVTRGREPGKVRRFAQDLFGGPNHPEPLLRRRRFWFLLVCWLFAASPLVAGLMGLPGTPASTANPANEIITSTTETIDLSGPHASADRFGVARSDSPVIIDLRPDLPATDQPATDQPATDQPESQPVPQSLSTFPTLVPPPTTTTTTTAATSSTPVDSSASAQVVDTTLQFHPYTTVLGEG